MASRDFRTVALGQPSLSVVGGQPVRAKPRSRTLGHVVYRRNVQTFGGDKDPDNEDIKTLLARLQTASISQDKPKKSDRLMNVKCSCGDIANLLVQGRLKLQDISEDDSDSDAEDSTFAFSELLRTLVIFNRKSMRDKRSDALRKVASSYNGDEILTDVQLKQLMEMYGSINIPLKEAVITVMRQVACNPRNAEKMIRRNVVYQLMTLLQRKDMKVLTEPVLWTLEKLLLLQEHSDIWMEFMVVRGLSTLSTILARHNSDGVRLAVLSVFKVLAANDKIGILIIDQCMEPIMDFAFHSDKTREIVTGILANLAAQNDHIIANILDWDSLPIIISTLKEGSCYGQNEGMRFLANLSECEYGLSVILEDHLVPYIIYALKESNCREVRQTACQTLRNILASKKVQQLRDLMLQVQKIGEKKERRHKDDDRTAVDTETLLKLGIGKKEVTENTEKGITDVVRTLVKVLIREAKMDINVVTGKVQSVGFRPSLDRFQTLSLAVDCLSSIVTSPLNKPRSRTASSRGGGGDAEKQVKVKGQNLNPNMVRILTNENALCVLDLLFAYTRKLTGDNQPWTATDNNIDVLHLQALLNAWEKPKNTSENASFMFDPSELNFVLQILKFISLLTVSCSQLVHEELEEKIVERMRESEIEVTEDVDEESTEVTSCHTEDDDSKRVTWCDPVNLTKLLHVPSDSSRPSSSSKRGKLSQRLRPSSGRKLYRNQEEELDEDVNVERMLCDKLDKGMTEFKKHLKFALVKEGIVESVGPWIQCDVIDIKVTVLEIIQYMIQPLQGNDYGMKSVNPLNKRPISAKSIAERDQALQRALNQMSDKSAGVMKDALTSSSKRQRPMSAPLKTKGKTQEPPQQLSWKPVIEFSQPLSWQCCLTVYDICGPTILHGLFSQNLDLKRDSLMLLHDAALFGETTVHMKLSALGCIPRLIEFLRVNDGNDLIEILGLMTLRSLISNDSRLKQMFVKHGGADMLMAMCNWSKGVVKEEVNLTLRSITRCS
ncbi:uncharacterized protein LOC144432956 isoform X2 [Glandiceps talaboti]